MTVPDARGNDTEREEHTGNICPAWNMSPVEIRPAWKYVPRDVPKTCSTVCHDVCFQRLRVRYPASHYQNSMILHYIRVLKIQRYYKYILILQARKCGLKLKFNKDHD